MCFIFGSQVVEVQGRNDSLKHHLNALFLSQERHRHPGYQNPCSRTPLTDLRPTGYLSPPELMAETKGSPMVGPPLRAEQL